MVKILIQFGSIKLTESNQNLQQEIKLSERSVGWQNKIETIVDCSCSKTLSIDELDRISTVTENNSTESTQMQ